MEITAIENYIVDTNNLTIPDKGLVNYKCGFTEERKPFNLQNIWLNLLPFFWSNFVYSAFTAPLVGADSSV